MPANRNALIRYKTIDTCLRNRFRKWTLEDLIEKVSDTLYEYEGIETISKRTIQNDIQMMRSDKLGYFAPIVVLEKKYYTYEDHNYSITNIPISDTDLSRMNEAVEMLKQFKGFSHFEQLNEVVQKLEDHVYSVGKKKSPVIDFEKNDNLKGLAYLDILYQAVIQKKAIKMTYQSFKAKEPNVFFFHVWWLKEFKNRWFAVGVRKQNGSISSLALDRIIDVSLSDDVAYTENQDLIPEEYYKNVIGVTVNNLRPMNVKIFVVAQHAPYVETKPLHHSQKVIERNEDGIIIEIKVQHNYELEKEILGFGEVMKVLSPEHFVKAIKKRLIKASQRYEVVGMR
ncbi:putative DNA-binding transcriptional regulator YafY [Arcicella aurantiaca]|uniref:Putative DNA-binding transcriptional regulator YafY n=1 Tax=Arcicella aurantiaca TaxID=591202 RepID=A0A316ECI0_9BACT|nr:WYL domain-containing protein [Arcicella aurantiaca]PWK28181.1 putative DNA-binding transcriptional regulator YafY [Arcicella aurantiaca]